MTIQNMSEEDYPPQYVMAVARLDLDEIDSLDIVETHVYDITKEGDMLTASCSDLHLIISAGNWSELEPRICKIHTKKMSETYGKKE